MSSKQRDSVDKRIEFACVTNSEQRTYRGVVVNVHAAIRLAFVLGARFGLSQPYIAGDFMAQWIEDHTMDCDAEELATRHHRALMACILPLTYTPDEFDDMEVEEQQ